MAVPPRQGIAPLSSDAEEQLRDKLGLGLGLGPTATALAVPLVCLPGTSESTLSGADAQHIVVSPQHPYTSTNALLSPKATSRARHQLPPATSPPASPVLPTPHPAPLALGIPPFKLPKPSGFPLCPPSEPFHQPPSSWTRAPTPPVHLLPLPPTRTRPS